MARAQHLPLTDREEQIARDIVDAAFTVHSALGPGLLEDVYTAQLLTYLKLARKRLGFLVNFNAPLIKDGIKRIIL